jgi:hypothetical protein
MPAAVVGKDDASIHEHGPDRYLRRLGRLQSPVQDSAVAEILVHFILRSHPIQQGLKQYASHVRYVHDAHLIGTAED